MDFAAISSGLTAVVESINSALWDSILLVLLCGTGIWFTIRLKAVQVRKFKQGLKAVFGNIRLRGDKAGADGMSSFQSLATAVAAQVGTGNIAGAATAIASGGPGAIFWMWLSAFFGMATIYAEASLAQKYKTTVDGEVTGGPVYYIKARFKGRFGKFLAGFFAVAITLALGFMGNMVQCNSISDSFRNAFGVPGIAVGIVVAAIAAVIFLGGKKRIASVTEKIVPVMAVLYILGSLVVIFANFRNLGHAFAQIFVLAFDPQAMAGGVAGITVREAIRFGVARGLFSNEAGMGSTPHAHALAKVKHPCDQGIVAFVGVFIDTFVVLTMTALVIISTGAFTMTDASGAPLTAAPLAQAAFNTVMGQFGNIFIAVCMFFFAFSTIIGWYFFGETNVKYLFGKKAVPVYTVIVILFVLLGSVMKVDLVWELTDLFNGLMVIPNLIGVLGLTGVVIALSREHDALHKLR